MAGVTGVPGVPGVPGVTGVKARRAPTLLGVVLGVVGVLGVASGCGSDPLEDYCDEVRAQQTPLTEAAAAGPTGLLLALPSFEALRAEAPADLAADWAVVVQRVSALDAALEQAGVEAASYDPENPPDDLTEEERAAIAAAASGLLTDAMATSLDRVQQQARDVCKTPLSL